MTSITFLGTASSIPSYTRNLSSLVVTTHGDSFIFDAGEATQHQLLRLPLQGIKASKIKHIFITHLHGDHLYGLPGLLCSLPKPEDNSIISIYGPVGLKDYMNVSLRNSKAKCQVCEISESNAEVSPEEYPNIFDNGKITIKAEYIRHTIPTLGFVIQEYDKVGKLDMERLKPILLQNNISFTLLKGFKEGIPITLENGDILLPEQFIKPTIKGKKIVILGDTYDPSTIIPLAMDADILVHEATNSYIGDEIKNMTEDEFETLVKSHGHSTPRMAGLFAKKINAKWLYLNHFSSRYAGDNSPESLKIMDQIKDIACLSMESQNVITAYDGLSL